MNSKSVLLIVTVVALAGSTGFLIGRQGGADSDLSVTSTEPDAASEVVPAPPPEPLIEADGVERALSEQAEHTVLSLLEIKGDFAQTAGLYALLSRSDVADLHRHLEDTKKIFNSSDRDAARSIIFMRYGELDPEGVIPFMYSIDLSPRDNTIFSMFGNWAKYDLDGAVQRVGLLREGNDQRVAINAIMRAKSDEKPEAIHQLAGRLGEFRGADSIRADALAAKASSDPVAALEAALQLADRTARINALGRIGWSWAQENPTEALNNAHRVNAGEERRYFRGVVLGAVAEGNPMDAYDLVMRLFKASERGSFLPNIIGRIAAKEPRKALKLAVELERESTRNSALSQVFNTWARTDPRAAATALDQLDDPNKYSTFGYQIARSFALKAPQAAMEWAERVSGTDSHLRQIVLSAISENDPHLALNLIGNLPASQQRAEMLSNILATVAMNDPFLALAEIDQLPEGHYRTAAQRNIAYSWARTDPAAAMDWLLTLSGSAQSEIMSGMGYQIAEHDLDLAISYLDELNDSVRADWLGSIVDRYANDDPYAAERWLREYSEHDNYPHWLGQIAAKMVVEDPEAAVRLLRRIENEDQLQMARSNLLHAWTNHDVSAAARWFNTLPRAAQSADLASVLLQNWYRFEPDAAVRWAIRLDDATRDQAISTLFYGQTMDDDTAVRLLNHMEDESQRFDAMNSYLQSVARYDSEAAYDFLARMNLPTDQRDQLIAVIESYNHDEG